MTTTLIQRLREACDLHGGNRHCKCTFREAANRFKQQAAQIKALRADAERFRYSITVNRNGRMNWRDVYDDWNGECEFADAIDAALRQEQPPT